MLNEREAVEQSALSTSYELAATREALSARAGTVRAAVVVSLLALIGGCLPLTGDGVHLALSPSVNPDSSSASVTSDSFQDPVGARLNDVLGLHSVTVARTESVLPTTSTGAIVNPTGCSVSAQSGPLFQRDGVPYRQGLTQRANAPVEIPPTTVNVDTAALLRTELTRFGTETDEEARARQFWRSPRMMTRQPELDHVKVEYAYARGLSGAGVRIAVDDDPVDILNHEFRGRIAIEGARIVYRQTYADDPTLRNIAFRFCRDSDSAESGDCSVWEINAGGDEQLVNEYARHIIEQHGYSPRENGWWIRDTSQSGENAWYEIPPFRDTAWQPWPDVDGVNPVPNPAGSCDVASNDRELWCYQPSEEYHHGTWVAATAAGWEYGIAPGATIVPIVRTISDGWDQYHEDEARIDLLNSAINGRLTTSQLHAIARTEASRIRELYANFDIINFSHGTTISPLHINAFEEEKTLADYFAEWWRAVQQIDESTRRRVTNPVIEVHAAGNDVDPRVSRQFDDGTNSDKDCLSFRDPGGISRNNWCRPSGASARPYEFESFRGHSIAVMAVDTNGKEEDYSNRCGDLPDRPRQLSDPPAWNANKHGRHYCLAAPGSVLAPDYGWRTGDRTWIQSTVDGTSFAAPMVSGALALMMQHFTNPSDGTRQMTSVEIVRRMLDTANNTGRYADSNIYGAGLLDLQAATAPVESTSMGTATVTASTTRSYAVLPRAYGDVGTRLQNVVIATFDAWNAPFFRSAADFVGQASNHDRRTIPQFASTDLTPNHLTTRALGLTREPAPTYRSGFSLLGHRTGLGVAWRTRAGTEFGALADTGSDQGAATAGAFGERVRSSMLWAQYTHEFGLGERWRGWATASLGAGKPDYADGMLQLSGSTYSAWEAGVHSRDRRWRFSVGQPWRAETGTGTLTYAAGRRLTGEHYYEAQRFSLVPRGRELAVQIRYSRPLGLGQLATTISGHNDFGHVQSATEARAGIAWRLQW